MSDRISSSKYFNIPILNNCFDFFSLYMDHLLFLTIRIFHHHNANRLRQLLRQSTPYCLLFLLLLRHLPACHSLLHEIHPRLSHFGPVEEDAGVVLELAVVAQIEEGVDAGARHEADERYFS